MLNETEIKYINENYNKIGATDCSRNLKRSRSAIVKNAKLLGLSLSHTDRSNIMRRKLDKPNNKRNVNPEQFINCKCSKDELYNLFKKTYMYESFIILKNFNHLKFIKKISIY